MNSLSVELARVIGGTPIDSAEADFGLARVDRCMYGISVLKEYKYDLFEAYCRIVPEKNEIPCTTRDVEAFLFPVNGSPDYGTGNSVRKAVADLLGNSDG